jgi:aspartyl-tRNA(Asn)/glutamyl-tRNA(Gln) amidotransferase subunit B
MPETLEDHQKKILAYRISAQQAEQLTASRSASSSTLAILEGTSPEQASLLVNWILGPISARMNQENIDFGQLPSKLPADSLRTLAARVLEGTISNTSATNVVLPAMWTDEGSADEIIEGKGLKQISDSAAIEKMIDAVIAANPQQVADFKAGKEKAFNSLVGQVMKASAGKANPAQVNAILRKKLG